MCLKTVEHVFSTIFKKLDWAVWLLLLLLKTQMQSTPLSPFPSSFGDVVINASSSRLRAINVKALQLFNPGEKTCYDSAAGCHLRLRLTFHTFYLESNWWGVKLSVNSGAFVALVFTLRVIFSWMSEVKHQRQSKADRFFSTLIFSLSLIFTLGLSVLR